MAKGIVYILTNPCLDGWVKIGMTERNDIERRLQELNAPTNIPLAYRCYATYEVDNPLEVEKGIHNLIDLIDDSLHARELLQNGRIREREFFKISPETAYGIFKNIAMLRNDVENLELRTPTFSQLQEQELAESRARRSNNSFKLLGISVGEEIAFLYDERIIAKVLDEKNNVEFEDKAYSVTGLATKILNEKYGWTNTRSANGWRFFTKDGITLSDWRDRIESMEVEE